MPELAEVEFFRKQWDPGLGSRILAVNWHPAARVFREAATSLAPEVLIGHPLSASEAHGKQMCFRAGPFWLGVHLGMSGELRVAPPDYAPAAHDHLVLRQEARSLVYRDPRQFGRIRLHCGLAAPDWWSDLPPQLLHRAFTVKWLAQVMARHPRMPLKPLLLRQEIFPGIGNWMADEILWRLGWSPVRLTGSLSQTDVAALRITVREVARLALRVIGRDWSDPPEDWLFKHRWRDGGLCPRDGTELRRAALGGRTTCWCPTCQVAGGNSRKRTARISGNSKIRRTASAEVSRGRSVGTASEATPC